MVGRGAHCFAVMLARWPVANGFRRLFIFLLTRAYLAVHSTSTRSIRRLTDTA